MPRAARRQIRASTLGWTAVHAQVALERCRTFQAVESHSGRRLRSIPEVDERRQYQRVEPEGARVEAVLSGKVIVLDIDNLSEGGALIAGRLDMEGGVTLDLRLMLPGLAPFSLPARVLRHLSRAGAEFTAVTFLSASNTLSHWIGELVLEGLYAAFPETD